MFGSGSIAMWMLSSMTYHGQQLTNEMNDCKSELELLRLELPKISIQPKSCQLLEAKISYLISRMETTSAINPLSIFPLTWETQVSAFGTSAF